MGRLAGEVGVEGAQVDQHEVVLSAARHQPEASSGQAPGQGLGVAQDRGGVGPELGLGGLEERHRLGGDGVLEGAALERREHRFVNGLGVLSPREDAASAGAAQRLVGGEGDHVGERHRVGIGAPGDEAGVVGGVEQQVGAHLVGDPAEGGGVDSAGVGGGPGDDELGPVLPGQVAHLVVVDALVGRGDPVGHTSVVLPADVDRLAVAQVAALVEAHAEDDVAGLQQGQAHGQVGVGPRVGLDVGVLGAEELACPPASQVLGLVDELVTPVEPPPGIPLGVLVGQHRSGGGHDRRRREVLRGDELQGGVLADDLAVDDGEQLVVADSPRGRAHRSCSKAVILSMRPAWRPPCQVAAKKACNDSWATSGPVNRAPMHTTLASLCSRARRAEVTSWTTAARTPFTLLAAIEIPMPVPHTHTPTSLSPAAMARPTAAPKSG